ncbi:MAG: hypothetical protein NC040_04010, partial [Muribaculaceae bacterium]|nr:hypothetical protein [Muribaculaceae bacterium]
MGGVKDITANKNTSLPDNSQIVENSDIVFDFTNPDAEDGYWRVNDKNVVDVTVRLDTHSTKITAVSAYLALEGGFAGKFSKKSSTLNAVVKPN